MNDTQLLEKIAKAAYGYKAVYGKFPDQIGVHYRRRSALPYSYFFPIMPELSFVVEDLDKVQRISIERHEVLIEPFAAVGMGWDDVFLPLPGNAQGAVKSEFIEKLAKEFE